MKKRKIFFAAITVLLGYWFAVNVKELYVLMKKYPNEFKQQGDFSFYRFYNTYRTLSYGDIMVKRGYVHHDICFKSTHYIDTKGLNCLKEAKLTNFEFNCKEAYATYACEVNSEVTEFTYTGNRNQKCFVGHYNKNFGLRPHPTLRETYNSEAWYPDSMFDSPECERTNR